MTPYQTDFATLGLVLALVFATENAIALNNTPLQENFPIVNKGVIEFYKINNSTGLGGLITRVEKCWADVENRKTQQAIAFCFSLDYSTSTFDELITSKKSLLQSDFTKIEKTLSRVNRVLKQLKVDQDKRGKLISGWTIAANAMLQEYAKRNGEVKPLTSKSENEVILSRVRAAILEKIRNQKLLQFQNVEHLITPNMRGEPTDVVCGKIKIQGSSDGKVRLRPFVYFVGDGTAYYDSGLPGMDDLDEHVVRGFCVN